MKKNEINDFALEVNKNAKEHGWWDKEVSLPENIALMHSELSEALEEYRNQETIKNLGCNPEFYYKEGNTYHKEKSDIIQLKPEGIQIELADCILRIMDLFAQKGWDLKETLEIKHKYNKSRPYRHGGKKI